MDEADRRIATEFARRVRGLVGSRLREIRVFGSRAREDARPDSDLDIWVLLDREDRQTRADILEIADDLVAENDYRTVPSPLVMGEERFGRLVAREGRLARDLLTEGIPIDV